MVDFNKVGGIKKKVTSDRHGGYALSAVSEHQGL